VRSVTPTFLPFKIMPSNRVNPGRNKGPKRRACRKVAFENVMIFGEKRWSFRSSVGERRQAMKETSVQSILFILFTFL
jgi:hypothetical protein